MRLPESGLAPMTRAASMGTSGWDSRNPNRADILLSFRSAPFEHGLPQFQPIQVGVQLLIFFPQMAQGDVVAPAAMQSVVNPCRGPTQRGNQFHGRHPDQAHLLLAFNLWTASRSTCSARTTPSRVRDR